MRLLKRVAATLVAATFLFTLTGCQMVENVRLIYNSGKQSMMTDEEIKAKKESKVIRLVDESLEAPVFALDLSQTLEYQIGASADTLTVEATAGNGTISYQWYINDANSNGGGTPIEGAAEPTYIPQTSEKGTSYYYCVATLDVGGYIREAASHVATVIVEDAQDVEVNTGEQLNNAQ